MGLQLQVVSKHHVPSQELPLRLLLPSADTLNLFLLQYTLNLLLQCTQNLQWSPRMPGQQHLSTTLILVRPMWGAMGPTRTPTATRLRRWCLRTSASPTQRRLAGHRTRNTARVSYSRTAQG